MSESLPPLHVSRTRRARGWLRGLWIRLRVQIILSVSRLTGVHPSMIPGWAQDRLFAAGVSPEDLERVTRSMGSLRGWKAGWEAEGDTRLAAGDVRGAVISYYFALRSLFGMTPLDPVVYDKLIHAYEAADSEHPVPLERLRVQDGGHDVAAWLQVPAREIRVPLAVMVPGVSSTKEDFHDIAAQLLEAGIAVCRLDLPGYGQTTGLLDRDTVTIPAAVARAAAGDERLDPDDVHFIGWCFGGTTCVISATQFPVRSVTLVSVPARIDRYLANLPPIAPSTVQSLFGEGHSTWHDVAGLLASIDAESFAPQVTSPMLVCTGGRDHLAGPLELEALQQVAGGPVEAHVFANEHHGCLTEPTLTKLIADFILRNSLKPAAADEAA